MKDNSKLSPALKSAINTFIDWFENNMGDEQWLDFQDVTNDPDGTWKSYLDLPEYTNLIKALERIKS